MNAPFQLNTTEESMPYILFYDDSCALVPNHWHKEIEVVYAQRGGTNMAINNVIYELAEGEVAVVLSGDSHIYFRSHDHVRLVVMFAPELFALNGSEAQRKLLSRMKGVARLSRQWQPEQQERVRDILTQLEALSQTQMFGRELAVRARIYDLVVLLCNDAAEDERQNGDLDLTSQAKMLTNLSKAFLFVEENYTREIELADAAGALGFTPSYFARFFKKYTNTTFMDYLTSYRISRVQAMLANDNKSITQIAEEAGFQSIKTFNRVFRDFVGLSPSQYKKSIFEEKEI